MSSIIHVRQFTRRHTLLLIPLPVEALGTSVTFDRRRYNWYKILLFCTTNAVSVCLYLCFVADRLDVFTGGRFAKSKRAIQFFFRKFDPLSLRPNLWIYEWTSHWLSNISGQSYKSRDWGQIEINNYTSYCIYIS